MLSTWNDARILSVIEEQVHVILAEKNLPAPKLSAADRLHDTLGLSSLDLAILVSELELALGTDPFAKLVPITSISTVGDLVNAYRLSLLPAGTATAPDDSLVAAAAERARRRASRRRS